MGDPTGNNNSINNNNNNSNSRNNNSINNNNLSMDTSNVSVSNDNEVYSVDRNYMPGTASLIEDVDKQLMIVLRDGRTLIGYLRSIDQYANLLISGTIERIHVGDKYGDIPRGVYIIRGENVVLLGEVDLQLPNKVQMIKVDVDEILQLQRIEQKKQEEMEKNKKKAFSERCLFPQTDATLLDEYY
jgi:U6 snRNA-associated Sm-like protein LSm1